MPDRRSNQGSFGKRGHVKVSPQPSVAPAPLPQGGLLSSNNSALKWAGGAVAGLFLLGLVSGGTGGGGGLLGGFIDGLLGHKIANSMRTAPSTATPASSPAPRAAAQSTTVQRGGFGSTGASGFSSAS